MKRILCILPALLLACDKPGVAPGLDTCNGSDCTVVSPGVIQGNVVYSGTARGDAVLLLFDTRALPPPDGTGTTAVAVARVPESVLFANAPGGSAGPFSAPFVFTQVPTTTCGPAIAACRSYQIRAFIDAVHQFNPFFDFTQQPRAGDPVGGYGAIGPDGQARLLPIEVAPAQAVTGINVGLIKVLPYDPPSFEIVGGGLALDVTMDRPARMQLRTKRLNVPGASFAKAHFGLELDRAPGGSRRSTGLDGLDDVFPQVFLRQIKSTDNSGALVPVDPANVAIVPCRVISTPLLPALVNLTPGADPLASDVLDVLVEPFALKFPELISKDSIPLGLYQVIVVERSGQVWTVPNSLGNPDASGTPYYASSQAAAVSVGASVVLPSGSLSGRVFFQGDPSTPRGNIIVQAYLDDPTHPPPPVGAATPVRVQIIRASDVVPGPTGFGANYKLVGLNPGQRYVIQALADVNGTFSPLNLLSTPTRGDLVMARPLSLVVTGAMTQDLALNYPQPLDPPAFEIDDSVGLAQIHVDERGPVRFGLVAKPLAFPIASAPSSTFTISLVRDANGKTVDRDLDGLPDVWPRVFLVRLDPTDPTNLSQYRDPADGSLKTNVIPAAVDPTPFLAALQPQNSATPVTITASKVTVVARPALLDATAPLSVPSRSALTPGRYKIVLMNQTGQLWQIPNEAGPAALDPSVVCAVSASSCAPGTVRTQSQGRYFEVLPPGSTPQPGVISGSLVVTGVSQFYGAYVFATDAANPPPPLGTGVPVAADFHSFLEFTGGAAAYSLQNLAPDRSYYLTAVVDTRGDFALSPQLYAAAPGQGTIVGGRFDSTGALVAVSPGPNIGVTAGAVLPARPSFQVIDSGLNPVSSDVQLFTQAAPAAARLVLQARSLLGAGVSATPETGTAFPVSYVGCVNGKPVLNENNLPDLWPKVALLKISSDDPTGLRPDPGSVVLPAAIDPVRFAGQLTCGGAQVAASLIDVLVAPAAFQPLPDGTFQQLATVPAGRYQIVVISKTGQVWRIPNELQPAMLDPRAAAAALQLATQSVAATVGAATLAAGTLSGVLTLSGGYSASNVGNVLIGAWLSTDLPPSLGGTGRPLAATVVPRSAVARALGTGLPYTLAGLPTGVSYRVGAVMDRGNTFSVLLSYMASPGIGAQGRFAPAAVAVNGPANQDLQIDAAADSTWPFERPMFAIDPASSATVDTTAAPGTVSLTLNASTPAALAYAPGTPAFHPILVPKTGGGYALSTQVVFSPLSAAAICAPVAMIDSKQYCADLYTDGTCATPKPTAQTTPVTETVLVASVPNNTCLRLSDKTVVAGAPTPGAYRINVLERYTSGSTWSIPNELASASSDQGKFLLVK
jgi:hypothetical protein